MIKINHDGRRYNFVTLETAEEALRNARVVLTQREKQHKSALELVEKINDAVLEIKRLAAERKAAREAKKAQG